MFSGIVNTVGTIEHAEQMQAGRELGIDCSFEDLLHGESIAVNGVCLTVRECGRGWFSVAAGEQTVQRTTIGEWHAGWEVNLERALRAGERLGGHIVQGHVDGVAEVTSVRDTGDVLYLGVELPPDLADLFVPLGSVALDGVSLTVDSVSGTSLQVAVIEYTRRNTTLGRVRDGSRVHVEADILAKYVRQMLSPLVERLTATDWLGPRKP